VGSEHIKVMVAFPAGGGGGGRANAYGWTALFSQQSGHAGTRHYGSVEARAVAWSNKYSTTGIRIREGSACVLSASQSARWPREP
jgi:hypothetical protein